MNFPLPSFLSVCLCYMSPSIFPAVITNSVSLFSSYHWKKLFDFFLLLLITDCAVCMRPYVPQGIKRLESGTSSCFHFLQDRRAKYLCLCCIWLLWYYPSQAFILHDGFFMYSIHLTGQFHWFRPFRRLQLHYVYRIMPYRHCQRHYETGVPYLQPIQVFYGTPVSLCRWHWRYGICL